MTPSRTLDMQRSCHHPTALTLFLRSSILLCLVWLFQCVNMLFSLPCYSSVFFFRVECLSVFHFILLDVICFVLFFLSAIFADVGFSFASCSYVHVVVFCFLFVLGFLRPSVCFFMLLCVCVLFLVFMFFLSLSYFFLMHLEI